MNQRGSDMGDTIAAISSRASVEIAEASCELASI